MTKTHRLALWTTPTADKIRAASDDNGHLLVFATDQASRIFCDRLETHGIIARSLPVSTRDVAELLHRRDTDEENDVVLVEARTTGPTDPRQWVTQVADRAAQMIRTELGGADGRHEPIER